ncbi:hypothetical protein [Cellulosilyticum ruminicola]|uniref:hypothetical protein n=1 Tax=Cellulosilyticum ruminicola TaxID=425254 RepID=UPI0006D1ABD0|nr:hypothetical protein [Cellulosilyticum ruminicola]
MANHLAGQGPVIQMQRKAILGRISDIVDWLAYKWGKLKNIKLEGSEEEIKDSEEERDTILEKMYRILGNGKWDFAINDEWMQTGQIRGGQGSNYYNLFKEIDTLLDEQGKQALNELLGRYDSNDERLKVLFTNNRAHKLGKQYAKVVEKKLSEEEVEQISEKMDEIYKDDQMNEIGIDKGGMFKILLQTNQNSIDEVIGVINKYSAEKTKEETVVSSDEYEEYKKFINSTYKDSLFEEGKNAFIYYVIKEQWQNTNFF